MQRRSTVFKDLALICAFLVIIGLCFKVKWMDSLFKPKKDD